MSLTEFAGDCAIIMNGQAVSIVKDYSVSIDLLTQPSKFTVTLGHSGLAADLMAEFPPGTSFELQIAGTTQFRGKTDGWGLQGDSGTTLVLMGRDNMAELVDATAKADKSFSDVSIEDIVKWALTEVYGAGNFQLESSDEANRKAMSNAGAKGKVTKSPSKLKSATSANRKVQVKFGMSLFAEFLKPQLDRTGLFLFAAQDGVTFILTELSAAQAPAFRIQHRRGDPTNTVVRPVFQNDTSKRYAAFEVWGRRGASSESRTPVKGRYVDQEMTDWGFKKVKYITDDKCVTPEQCEALARRRAAESRRANRQLAYTTAGHKTIGVNGSTMIWSPNMVCKVDDEEIDLDAPHLVEGVQFEGGEDKTTTTIKLLRAEDVLFGEEA